MNENLEMEAAPDPEPIELPCECHVCKEIEYINKYKSNDVLMLGVAMYIRRLCLRENGIAYVR